jgi:beta-glucosidase
MTTEEKIGQLNLEPNEAGLNVDEIRSGVVGNIICSATAFAGKDKQERVRAARMNELQRIAKESRLGIPLLVGRDVIHGHLTVAPIPLGQAASWSPADIEACSMVASREAKADGINWIYAPMLDIGRDARWGRVAEGYGEDPFLCSALGAAAIRGLQNPSNGKPTIAACAKHYVAYGTVEGGRDYNSGEVSAYTLRNIYLPSFKAAIEAGAISVMTCFNDLGGVPVTADAKLVRNLLKEEWGFGGFTVSDWNAVAELIEHRIAENPEAAAELALRAGIDLDMTSKCYKRGLGPLLRAGKAPQAHVDDAVRRILQAKANLGLFEDPFTDESLAGREHLSDLNKITTLELARKTPVLLENKGAILPLTPGLKIGLFGPLAQDRGSLLGTWCVDGQVSDVISMWEAMEGEFGKRLVETAVMSDEAISKARYCDVAVAAVGEFPHRSGEANSVTSIELPPGQMEFLEGLKRVGVPIVAVVFGGRPLALTRLSEIADAILFAWHPGTLGSIAIAEILSGKTAPSGRLPITFPRSTGQVPIYYNYRSTGRPLDPWLRGDSRYLDESDAPLYPFGFGLHYSHVAYSDLSVQKSGEAFKVTCAVVNEGATACDEVAQLYLRDHFASAARPVRELKGFQRLALIPNEKRALEFLLTEQQLGFYGPDERWRVEKGEFTAWVGKDSRCTLSALFSL